MILQRGPRHLFVPLPCLKLGLGLGRSKALRPDALMLYQTKAEEQKRNQDDGSNAESSEDMLYQREKHTERRGFEQKNMLPASGSGSKHMKLAAAAQGTSTSG